MFELIEKKLERDGFHFVAGVDEAGRGALAGPIVACAVIMPQETRIEGVRDSKELTPKKRWILYKQITSEAVCWAVGLQSAQSIDERGITWANKQIMKDAVGSLTCRPDIVLTDYLDPQLSLPTQTYVKGDQRVYSIAAASIIAKVTRDIIVSILHKHYSRYGFDKHKGYGTALHRTQIHKYGMSKVHRKSFLKNILQ